MGFGFGDDEAVQQNDLRSTIPYEVELTGIDPQEEQLIASLNGASTAQRLQSRPTASRAGLQRRAEDDIERFQAVLRSKGFYEAQVTFDIAEKVSTDPVDPQSPDAEDGSENASEKPTENKNGDIDGSAAGSEQADGADAPTPLVLRLTSEHLT